jgi:hypothetical protein
MKKENFRIYSPLKFHQPEIYSRCKSPRSIMLSSAFSIFLLSACGMTGEQKSLTTSFGAATASYSDLISEELRALRSGSIQLRQSAFTLPGARSSDVFSRNVVPRQQGYIKLENQLTLENLDRPIRLSALLKDYGQGLVEIASAGENDLFKQRFASIGEGLTKIPGFENDGTRIKGVAATAGPVAGLAADAAKRQMVQDIVAASDPFVQKAADLLASEFTVSSDRSLAAYDSSIRLLDESVYDAFATVTSSKQNNPLATFERQSAVGGAELLQVHKSRLAVLESRVAQASKSLKETHSSLVESFNNNEVSHDVVMQFNTETETVNALLQALR